MELLLLFFGYIKYLGILLFLAVSLFLFFKGVKNFYYIFFKPYKYIEDNHGDILKKVVDEKFGNKLEETITKSVNVAKTELILPSEVWKKIIDETVLETLDEVGIQNCIHSHKSYQLDLTKRLSDVYILDANYKKSLLELIQLNSKKSKALIGKHSKTTYEYYIDLRQVLPNGEIAIKLNNILMNYISDFYNDKLPAYDFVAVNRNSNTIFGYLLSNLLNLPLLIVNYDSTRWILDGEEIKIDGIGALKKPYSKRKGFLIDDAVSGGSVLKESCRVLKNKGLSIDDVFVLFSRKEDNAIDSFSAENITLHSIFNLNDNDIRKIMKTEVTKLESIINEFT